MADAVRKDLSELSKKIGSDLRPVFTSRKIIDDIKGVEVKPPVIKVIPLKLFYHQTFFETWRNEHSSYELYKDAMKIMESPSLFTRQQALKMGYFYWLRVKSSNHLHTELNLGYLKGKTFCLESKASFIDISSITSFKPFLIAWLREYCTFSDSSVVNLKSSP